MPWYGIFKKAFERAEKQTEIQHDETTLADEYRLQMHRKAYSVEEERKRLAKFRLNRDTAG